jgi:hypothetical protein
VFPEGILTREIKVGPAFDLQSGAPYSIRVMVAPTRSLVWGATGDPVVSRLKTYVIPANETGTIELPATNQEGFETADGGTIELGEDDHAFGYKISVFYLKGGAVVRSLPSATVVLPEGDESVDIDDLVPFSGHGGTVISTPDKWSEQVTAAQAAATAAAASAAAAEAFVEGLEGNIDNAVNTWFDNNQDSVVSPDALAAALDEHRNEEEPHKAYDLDLPSLTVLFENGLV